MKDTCIIKLLDEVNAVIIGLRESELRQLSDHYALPAKNHRFHPKYKLGIWDGKIRFFTLTGKTYINLLDEIISLIKTLGYKIELKDCRKVVDMEIPEITNQFFSKYILKGNPIVLANHQVESVNAITQDSHKGCIEAGTGAGKSLINAALCSLYNTHCKFKTLTIVPTTDLVDQTKKVFEIVELDVGEYSGSVKDLNHQHIICTWQSIKNNLKILSMFNVVIADEAHNVTGKSLQLILNEYGSHIVVRVGLTGTIPLDETDALTLKATLGEVKYKIKSAELIEKGWLAQVSIKMYQLVENLFVEWEKFNNVNPKEAAELNYKKFKEQAFPDFPSERKYLHNKKTRNQFLAELIIEKSSKNKGNTLVIVTSIEHGKNLQALVPNSYFIDGTDKKKIRREIYDLFETNHNLVVIATAKLVSTGLDIPRIFHVFLIDIGKAFTTIIQSIGRGLRKAIDKDSVEVFDLFSDLTFAKRHYRDRKKYYNLESYNFKLKSIEYD